MKKNDKNKDRMRTKIKEITHFSEHSCKPDVAASEVKINLILQEKE